MNQHLSSEQISKCVAGEATPEERSHLGECEACGADLARLEAAVGSFRDTVRHWSEQTRSEQTRSEQTRSEPNSAATRQTLADSSRNKPILVQVLRFAAAAAIVVIMVGVPMWRLKQQRADLANQDDVLLEQIASGLSRSVAQPMQPLTRLWTTGGTAGQADYR